MTTASDYVSEDMLQIMATDLFDVLLDSNAFLDVVPLRRAIHRSISIPETVAYHLIEEEVWGGEIYRY